MKQNNLSRSSEQKAQDLCVKDFKNNHKEVKNNNLVSPGKTPGKPRLSSTERKHLAELVQQNMERHHAQQQRQLRWVHVKYKFLNYFSSKTKFLFFKQNMCIRSSCIFMNANISRNRNLYEGTDCVVAYVFKNKDNFN